MLGVIDVNVITQIAAFAPLTEDDDARFIQHRRARQRPVGTQKTHIIQRAQVVTLQRRKLAHQLHHSRCARVLGFGHQQHILHI
ncbi:hypothetical protein D3C71_659090 [compost metagenome]